MTLYNKEELIQVLEDATDMLYAIEQGKTVTEIDMFFLLKPLIHQLEIALDQLD